MPKHKLSKKRIKELFGVEVIEAKGPPLRRLSSKAFEAAFGIPMQSKPTRKEVLMAKGADELLSDMYVTYEMNSLGVFRAAVADLHSVTIHKMSECPQFVIDYMKKRLDRTEMDTIHKKKVANLNAIIEKAQSALRRIT